MFEGFDGCMEATYASESAAAIITMVFQHTDNGCKIIVYLLLKIITLLTLKAPRKTASENVVCLFHLLNILADFSNLFLHTGKQCGP